MGETSCYHHTPPNSGGNRSTQESQNVMNNDPTRTATTKTPLLSILNVVVDYAMMAPSPMEPMEFREVCRWNKNREQKDPENENSTGRNNCNNSNTNSNSNAETSGIRLFELSTPPKERSSQTSHYSQTSAPAAVAAAEEENNNEPALPSPLSTENICIKVPILRIFGPVLRDGKHDEFINSSSSSSQGTTIDPQFSHSQSSTNTAATASTTAANATQQQQQQTRKRIPQPQSGCLHVHGAYPYMLARPIVAGPDGSMMHHGYHHHHHDHHHDGDNNSTSSLSGRINWDDANSVSYILEEVHCRLEMTLRASYEQNGGGGGGGVMGYSNQKEIAIPGAAVGTNASSGNYGDGGGGGANRDANNDQSRHSYVEKRSNNNSNSSSSSNSNSNPTPLFVRQVTVVAGRGFYTYCSGPPAPFLKVEYYDPSARWRVKMALERGLDLCELYHPDPRQYDYVDGGTNANDSDGSGGGGGGHGANDDDDIRPLKFRCYEAHIPYTMQVFKDCNLAGMKYVKVGEARFRNPLPRSLRKRTKEEFTASHEGNDPGTIHRPNDNALFLSHTVPKALLWPKLEDVAAAENNKQLSKSLNEHWLKKQTCCDVEFDSTVQQLLNVMDVMTELPSPLEERQKIHWRAVPSLREIWEQERKRMSILLPPEKDFLSCKEEEEEADTSCESDDDEEEDEDEDDDVDKQAGREAPTSTPPFSLNVKKGASVPGARLAIKGIKQLFRTSSGLEADYRRALRDILSKHEKFIDDVDRSMKGQCGALTNNARGNNPSAIFQPQREESQVDTTFTLHDDGLAPYLDEGIEALAALGDQFSQWSAADGEDAANPDRAATPNSRMQPFDVRTPIAKKLTSMKKFNTPILSQMDKEEEIEMLTFGERIDREDAVQNNMKENDNADLSTMPTYDGEDDFDEEDDDVLVEEERMGEAGLEKALTQLATQSGESNEESSVDVWNYYESHLEINYPHSRLSSEINQEDLPSDDECFDAQIKERESQFGEAPTANDADKFRLSNLSQPSEESFPSENAGQFIVDGYESMIESISQQSVDDLSQNHITLTVPTSDFVVEPRKLTTLRCGEIMKQQTESTTKPWHALPSATLERCPSWFLYKWECSGGPPTIPKGSFVEPVKRPPSFAQVKSWVKSHRKRSQPPAQYTDKLAKQRKVAAGQHSNNTDSNNEVGRGKGGVKFIVEGPPSANKAYGKNQSQASSYLTSCTQTSQLEETQTPDPLAGLGHQGCKVQVSSGGGLKTQINTSTTFTPLTIMSIEVHVQCRTSTGSKDRKDIAMVPDSSRDAVFAVVYVYGRDPGGGESLEILERGCVLVMINPKGRSSGNTMPINISNATIGVSSDVTMEQVNSERSLLRRIASIVQLKDPDALVSWDTQGAGVGYLVERGVAIGKPIDGSNGSANPSSAKIDVARLLGRTPRSICQDDSAKSNVKSDSFGTQEDDQKEQLWSGSGLGSEWDDRVGAGSAASSIVGRIVLCGWKICSEECKHPNASYQPAIVSAVLNKRIPFHDDLLLTKWYGGNNGVDRWRVVEHRLAQAMSNVLLLDALDVLGRAGEAARLSGVEFSQSLPGIRGSQYKVEGVLLRALQSVQSNERGEKKGLNKDARWQGSSLTSSHESQSQSQSPWKLRRQKEQKANCVNPKDSGYFFYSPSKMDCSNQEALECQAMTLEPKSGFHFDPVVVCDFTALYPSLVIAYNFCYSTVAGKLDYHSTRREMRCSGRTTSKCGPFFYSERRSAAVIKHHMKSLSDSNEPKKEKSKRRRDRAYAIPTGSIFVSESVLKGVLPQVLDEMLSTRAMLKRAAKVYKKQVRNLSPAVLRQIEARQLALKYVANVTYGYTSATFSGRSAVPLVADAIVECGRRTLTNAIDLANRWGKEKNGKWYGCTVLYGDTDSVFIKLPGRSIKEAFSFGEEYCAAVTASNPPPVQLKLEKVYSGCLLQTKKKYCGMMYESPTQKHPTFEAKGIETVRRDQCTITQRILRNALTHAFQRGIGHTKDYLYRQWALIHSGRLPVSDFVLTGRVRSRYRGGKVGPVQASLAKRLAEVDPGRVVRHKERLPYVIVAMPGQAFRLRDGVLTPLELLEQWDSYSINSEYYTMKHVNAALQRCFGLPPFKINIQAWYNSCPKPRRRIHHWPTSRSATSSMISSFFGSDTCALCDNRCKSTGSSRVVVCHKCKTDSIAVACTVVERLQKMQQQANRLAAVCSACNGCLESLETFAREEIWQPPKRREHSLGTFNLSSRRVGRLCTPIANCACIDCPITYERHKIRESEIEATELCQALDLH